MLKLKRYGLALFGALTLLIFLLFVEVRLLVNTQKLQREAFEKTVSILRETEFKFIRNSNLYFIDTLATAKSFATLTDKNDNKEIGLCLFHYDSLLHWNSQQLNTQKYFNGIKSQLGFLTANNGYYITYFSKFGTYSLVQYYQLKSNYAYQNQYISNHFNNELNFLGSALLSPSPIKDFFDINDSKGNYLFSIKIFGGARLTPLWLQVCILVNLIIIVLLFNALLINLINSNFLLATFLFFGLNLTAKWLLLKLKIPVFIYSLPLFSAEIYASSAAVPSLGDFLIMALLALWYLLLLNKTQVTTESNRLRQLTRFAFIALLCMVVSDTALDSIKSLVFDSQVSFELSNIYSLNVYTFLALFLAFILLLVVYEICNRFFKIFISSKLKLLEKILITAFMFYFVHPYLVRFLYERNAFYPIASSVLIAIFLLYFVFVRNKINRLQQYYILVAIFSGFISFTIQYWSAKEEEESRKLYATKILAQNDISTEYFLKNAEVNILKDADVKTYFNNPLALQSQLVKRLRQLYFSGYLSRYDVSVYDYDTAGNFFRDRNPLTFRQVNFAYNELGNSTIAENFKLLKSTAYLKGYLARFRIFNKGRLSGYLFVHLQPKLLQDENRFDELLIEGYKSQSNKKRTDYSYAIYKDNKLLTQSGKYAYRTFNIWPPKVSTPFYFFNSDDGYNHLIFSDEENYTVLVSRKANNFYEPFGLFSLSFTFFTLILVISLLFYAFINMNFVKTYKSFGSKQLSLVINYLNRFVIINQTDLSLIRSQIQLAVLFIVFVTLSATAVFTINFINGTYQEKQNDKLIKKLRGVVSAIETDLILDRNLNRLETDAYLNQIGDYYDTDITFFNTQGNVEGSTINKLYQTGIVAPLMDANAYYHLHTLRESQYTQTESVATFKFTGAYLPVVDRTKNVIGYIMLPYFNKLADLYAEISSIIVGFINLYALLFIIIGILAWLISRNISYPLVLIQRQLASTTLGKKNEPINWNKNDEIGQLVKQYNQMISALEESAELLAQSEREGAWRDIARQIAHEIKNPLTPMKLSVQHLERAWNDNSPKLPETFKRVTQTLINQINTLSDLAGEFSSFAKMPTPIITDVQLNNLISAQVHLYSPTFNGKMLWVEPKEEIYVKFDEGFLNRTLTNLIKNAMQAIPDNREGVVEISIEKTDESILIKVSDNGVGISTEQAQKIFTPYYSTKSFGMGLGLPIVKSMIESANGKIWFETIENAGTTFLVQIPLSNIQ